ncbi:endoplasmic reticulum protein [Stereum hirsutum FP-91666 SS1]|uniref:endoplasmic reticulum protein n=1 Tax=Stereum hirsutum (strain FP-91666) TaxID=721885 RepID=UPI000440F120|nr:endoplasmic reticulum protein [Stereum hirsutum FP-91666 SS1]EIM92749.1 endoplasmic reticulum protein [Stereum hirsutum FP-91666 SS1]
MRTTFALSRAVSLAPARTISRTRLSRPLPMLSFSIRFNSTQQPRTDEEKAARQAALAARDKLQSDWRIPVIPYEVVKQKSQQPSTNEFLIDVREPDEVIQGSIPSSVNLPLSELAASLKLGSFKFEQKYGFKKPTEDQEIIFYCRSGKRSATASDVAKRNGYKNINNYEGSWLDWVKREGTPSA